MTDRVPTEQELLSVKAKTEKVRDEVVNVLIKLTEIEIRVRVLERANDNSNSHFWTIVATMIPNIPIYAAIGLFYMMNKH